MNTFASHPYRSFAPSIALAVTIALTGSLFAGPAFAKPPASAPPSEGTDLELSLPDTDGDSYPDRTEEIGGTDPYDAASNPQALTRPSHFAAKDAFPPCRSGFTQRGLYLCVTGRYGPYPSSVRFELAAETCRNARARLCTYNDFFYIFNETSADASYNPYNTYIGNVVADDGVLCGNASVPYNNHPNIWNFEGNCGYSGANSFFCCYDRDQP